LHLNWHKLEAGFIKTFKGDIKYSFLFLFFLF